MPSRSLEGAGLTPKSCRAEVPEALRVLDSRNGVGAIEGGADTSDKPRRPRRLPIVDPLSRLILGLWFRTKRYREIDCQTPNILNQDINFVCGIELQQWDAFGGCYLYTPSHVISDEIAR